MDQTLKKIDFQIMEQETFSHLELLKSEEQYQELLDGIKNKALEYKEQVPTDMSKKKNRAALKSLGAKIGTQKSWLAKAAKTLIDANNEKIKDVTEENDILRASAKKIDSALKELRLEIVREAKEWEKNEQERVEDIKELLLSINEYTPRDRHGRHYSLCTWEKLSSAEEIEKAHKELSEIIFQENLYQEFISEAEAARQHRLTELENAMHRTREQERRKRIEEEMDYTNTLLCATEYKKDSVLRKQLDWQLKSELSEIMKIAITDDFEAEKSLFEQRKNACIGRLEQAIADVEQAQKDAEIERAAKKEADRKRNDQEAEKKRINIHNINLQALRSAADKNMVSSAVIQARIEELCDEKLFSKEQWEEFHGQALAARDETLIKLKAKLKEAEKREEKERQENEKQLKEQAKNEAQEKLEKEQAEKEKLRKAREKDQENRQRVESEALADMLKLGFDKAVASKLLFHIKSSQIRNLFIEY